jgi:hypothetical protein
VQLTIISVFGLKRGEVNSSRNKLDNLRVESHFFDDSPPKKEDKVIANLDVSQYSKVV